MPTEAQTADTTQDALQKRRVEFGRYIYKLVRNLHEQTGLSQQDIASKAGISPTHLSRVIRGTAAIPKLKTLERLADALCVDKNDLFKRAGFNLSGKDSDDAGDGALVISNLRSTLESNIRLMQDLRLSVQEMVEQQQALL